MAKQKKKAELFCKERLWKDISRSDGKDSTRRNVTQGGVTLDGEKVTDFKASYTLDDFSGEGKVLKRGKKKFIKIVTK